MPPPPPDWEPHRLGADAWAVVQYTSGSTSTPRGVVVTHGNLEHVCRNILELLEWRTRSVTVSWLPLFHDMGFIGHLVGPVWLNTTSVLMPPEAFLRSPSLWLRAASACHAETSGAPTFGYRHCVRRVADAELEGVDLSGVRCLYCGSEPVDAGTMRDFFGRFRRWGLKADACFPCYGLAETTLIVSGGFIDAMGGGAADTASRSPLSSSPQLSSGGTAASASGSPSTPSTSPSLTPPSSPGLDGSSSDDAPPPVASTVTTSRARAPPLESFVSCGRVASRLEVAIVDPATLNRLDGVDEDGRRSHPTMVGEVWVRGGGVCSVGYLGDAQATEASFRARYNVAGGDVSGGAPWLRTGDLGVLRGGNLYVTGRLKETIIVRGRNLLPVDIEASAQRCHEALRPGCGVAFQVQRVDADAGSGDARAAGAGERVMIAQELTKQTCQALRAGGSDVRAAASAGAGSDLPDAAGSARTLAAVLGHSIAQAVAHDHGVRVDKVLFMSPGSLPKTTSGKLRRVYTAQLYASGSLKGVLCEHTAGVLSTNRSGASGGGTVEASGDSAHAAGPSDSVFDVAVRQIQAAISAPSQSSGRDTLLCYAGLDSFQIVVLHAHLERSTGRTVPRERLFHMTCGEVAAMLARGGDAASGSDCLLDAPAATPSPDLVSLVDEVWRVEMGPALTDGASTPKSVPHAPQSPTASEPTVALLTGATGFVGAFFVRHILGTHATARVVCLVRPQSGGGATSAALRQRVVSNLAVYDLVLADSEAVRLSAVAGDVCAENLGLCAHDNDALLASVDCIVHCAAVDNFVAPFEAVAPTNVVGTARVLAFAARCGARVRHVAYVSSCAAHLAAQQPSAADCDCLYNGYARTKLAAEALCVRARDAGVNVACYRLGYLYDTTSAEVAEADSVEQVLRLTRTLGCAPDMGPDVFLDLTPVEYAVAAMWADTMQGGTAEGSIDAAGDVAGGYTEGTWGAALLPGGTGGQAVKTLHHPAPVPWNTIVDALRLVHVADLSGRGSRGADLSVVPLSEWLGRARKHITEAAAADPRLLKAAAGSLASASSDGVDAGAKTHGSGVGRGLYCLLPVLTPTLPAHLCALFSPSSVTCSAVPPDVEPPTAWTLEGLSGYIAHVMEE